MVVGGWVGQWWCEAAKKSSVVGPGLDVPVLLAIILEGKQRIIPEWA